MTTITIEELRKLAAAGAVSLPSQNAADTAGGAVVNSDRAARVAELLKTVRDLTKDRSPEETAALERWLEERDA
ncbi:hypothetical protein [Bosea vaviloviae]|uniref:Uncharacterized protein n=1 Tax=Bosea vaviloviae TaxID=1526658 RepID=A0A1D7U3E7_9HYPH|nr:hypothetical protein [Bosea vaviloviae]AOO81904.1 hypothetical protein BHK69_16900 [Bosea vaviloviae]